MEKRVEEILKFFDDYKKASNAATGAKYDPNSNVTCKNICTMQAESIKKLGIDVQRAIAYKYIKQDYSEELATTYLSDLKNHLIYVHDESNLSGMPYCCSVTLYPFLLNGLKDLGGSSLPPKHANSFIGGIINLIFLLAGQFAGAVAVPEFLPYLDYFIRKDYGEDYTQYLEETINEKTKETLKNIMKIGFNNLFIPLINPQEVGIINLLL